MKRISLLSIILIGVLLIVTAIAFAQDEPAPQQELATQQTPRIPPGSRFHPTFVLFDMDGNNVLDSGKAVSTTTTCGTCHDTSFINEHSSHADVGLSTFAEVGTYESGHTWDTSLGAFGKWNPLNYRYLSPDGDEVVDMTTPEWVMKFGNRHIGGGPAVYSRNGEPLTSLTPSVDNPETSIIDPETGERLAWDWNESGVVEMNCFLCHSATPNNEARIATLASGDFGWANTATLLGTGLIEQNGETWEWIADAFDEDGKMREGTLFIQDPTSLNCGQCHGLVEVDAQTPLVFSTCEADQWSTITTGQIISPQKISNTGMNIVEKYDIARTFDVHAERVLECTNCHFALNNPIYYQEDVDSRPDHLTFDPRRIDLGEYLYRPLHEFAKGSSAQGTLADEFDNTLRRCESCHSLENTHNWLPYKDRHTDAMACETCHIPEMIAPAREYVDRTVLTSAGEPVTQCRGVEGDGENFGDILVVGFEPALLPRDNGDDTVSLAPHNLVSYWYWVYGDAENQRPVPERDLEAVYFDGETYATNVLATFDQNKDGILDKTELVIDTDAKETLIAEMLAKRGLENPRIIGEVQPYNINHDVTHGDYATRNCDTCHTENSRLAQPVTLSDRLPGGVIPVLSGNIPNGWTGEVVVKDNGEVLFQPTTGDADLYVLGHNKVRGVDWFGAFAFLATIGGVSVHGGLRYMSARRNIPHSDPELQKVYMYSVYERQWHWLQTVVIFILLFTGLIIHKPDMFGMFSFRYVVLVHNATAFILIVNAALAAFYHLASGEIQQFLPRPYGFFDQAFAQAKYYLRGIFRNEPHPFEKTPQHKMNPLQQMTYLVLLNILLPLQVITGLLMWGAQHYPDVTELLGGLDFLAPLHSLVAWMLAAFIVAHVYLTTTAGRKPYSGIQSMITGWDKEEH